MVVNAVVVGAIISKLAQIELVNSVLMDKLAVISFLTLVSDVVLTDGLISLPTTICLHVCIYPYLIANERVELLRVLRSEAGLQGIVHSRSSKKFSLWRA